MARPRASLAACVGKKKRECWEGEYVITRQWVPSRIRVHTGQFLHPQHTYNMSSTWTRKNPGSTRPCQRTVASTASVGVATVLMDRRIPRALAPIGENADADASSRPNATLVYIILAVTLGDDSGV
jgi:hypothetical protein